MIAEDECIVVNKFPEIKDVEFDLGQKVDLYVPKLNLIMNKLNKTLINQVH